MEEAESSWASRDIVEKTQLFPERDCYLGGYPWSYAGN
jgi:hypothetical protein